MLERFPIEPVSVGHYSSRVVLDLAHVASSAEQVSKISSVRLGIRSGDDIRWANEPLQWYDPNSALPHAHHIVRDVALYCPLVLGPIRHLLLADSVIEIAPLNSTADRDFQDWQIWKARLPPLSK